MNQYDVFFRLSVTTPISLSWAQFHLDARLLRHHDADASHVVTLAAGSPTSHVS